MEVEKLNVSVVVLAREHNPSILHPAFLSSQGIMPESEELAGSPLCTPPLSVVKYKSGISFSVEKNKFQVLQSPPPEDWKNSKVPQLAILYIKSLPHVNYTAVGINFSVLLKPENPERYLVEKFLDKAKTEKGGLRLKTAGLRLVYPLEEAVLNLTCEPGELESGADPGARQVKKGVIVNGNYHQVLKENAKVGDASAAISGYGKFCAHFEEKVLKEIFEV